MKALALAASVTFAVPEVAAHDVVATTPPTRIRDKTNSPRFMGFSPWAPWTEWGRTLSRRVRQQAARPGEITYATTRTGRPTCKRLTTVPDERTWCDGKQLQSPPGVLRRRALREK